jgi:membrane carboxypeptidase/penicillin-binding protein
MENVDIIILSSIVCTLFIVFIGLTARELINAPKEPQPLASEENGPRTKMIRFIGRLFDSPPLTKQDADKKIEVYDRVYRSIADMESDGVYFPEEIKRELIKKREELWCEYSNLPSVKSYEE